MFGHQDQDNKSLQSTSTDGITEASSEPAADAVLSNDVTTPSVGSAGSSFSNGAADADEDTSATSGSNSSLPSTDNFVATSPSSSSPPADLLDIKQQALQDLSPLVGKLDQSPEEKFRTTMMMIQASDDQGLIKVAYEAAQGITDEKARAQALLDVVNEINYFTQHTTS